MDIYHVINGEYGGSIYDSNWNKIGYTLPSIIGKGYDYYDLNGNALGQSYELALGGEGFTSSTGEYGFLDGEIQHTQDLFLDGKLNENIESSSEQPFNHTILYDNDIINNDLDYPLSGDFEEKNDIIDTYDYPDPGATD